MTPTFQITEYNDPGCPYGYSAEPWRHEIKWLYGDAVQIDLRLVGLTDDPDALQRSGFTPEMNLANWRRFSESYGMPFSFKSAGRHPATVPACRAVVAARLHGEPGSDRLLMRWLRIHRFQDELFDEQPVLDAAASDAGIDPAELAKWVGDPATATALEEDMKAARSPSREAKALDHKLGGPPDERRYTCPSWEYVLVDGDAHFSAPGFQSREMYEAVIANLAPGLSRRAPAEDPVQVLEWAGEPLATIEVAKLMGVNARKATDALKASGADEIALETSSLWKV
ncbi:MAG TPA: DsbA family protein [Baekduia sp.]|nr:DsbA family protein [Baekduia sp.]